VGAGVVGAFEAVTVVGVVEADGVVGTGVVVVVVGADRAGVVTGVADGALDPADVVRSARAGLSVRSTGAAVTGAVGRRSGTAVSDPPLRNGFSSTSAISATGTTTMARVVTRRGPPYRPIGPRSARPCWSTQNTHRSGAFGQDFGGCHRRGGRQSGVGGSGHSGGVLNCRTFHPPRTAA
jgi:hypothetical protein